MSQSSLDSHSTDQWRWLEEVESPEALEWVVSHNQKTVNELGQGSEYQALTEVLLKNKQRESRIPGISKVGNYYYNFWQDAQHPRGIWRRTSWESYLQESPEWEILLDIDLLNQQEDASWVWHGCSILRPQEGEEWQHCLISLSRGGADADVTREFDLVEKKWVENGFYRPEAKGSVGWIDHDHVFVMTDFGEGSMTTSGYPRQVKRWTRGTPLSSAELVFECDINEMMAFGVHDSTPGFERNFVQKMVSFYSSQMLELLPDGSLFLIDVPDSAETYVHNEWLFVELKESWEIAGAHHAAGSLLVIDYESFKAGSRDFHAVFTPTPGTAYDGLLCLRHHFVLETRKHVRQQFEVLTPQPEGAWHRQPMEGLPQGDLHLSAVDDEESDDFWLYATDFITPTQLFRGSLNGSAPRLIKSTEPAFNAKEMSVEQYFATSLDGTQIPYFTIFPCTGSNGSEDVSRETLSPRPTVLYGYGGFEVSLTPYYMESMGSAWLSAGGVMVMANIRGGGEYGPDWHRAALTSNRHKAYEDFAAVARDLVSRGITTVEQLGIMGGSNGGLLVGNMVSMYPQLFKAAVCQVPLLDMQRYHLLLAGASWMAEYGDPDSADWENFLKDYSPYHTITADKQYPDVLFTTTTRDDRVHPGHARKMMARMEEMGSNVLFFENMEGGHGSGADARQQVQMEALEWTFFKSRLMS